MLQPGAGACALEMYSQGSGSLQSAAGSRACSARSLPTHSVFAASAGAHSEAGLSALLRLLLLASVQLLVHQHIGTYGIGLRADNNLCCAAVSRPSIREAHA